MVEPAEQIPTFFNTVKSDNGVSCGRFFCDLQIHAVITFKGLIDADRLQKAIRLSFDVEPVLGCRLAQGKRSQEWLRRKDLDSLELCGVTETSQQQEALTHYLAKSLDPYHDPLIQAHIFRAKSDILCLKVNHIVSDAGGVKEYLSLLADLYSTLDMPAVNLSGRRSQHQVTGLFSLIDKWKILMHSWQLWRSELLPPQNWSFPANGRDLSERTFLIKRIESSSFKNIKEYAGNNGYSINDIITAALCRSFFKLIQPEPGTPLRLGMTVDLRRYLPARKGEAVTNLASLFLLNLGPLLGDRIDETISLVHDRMNSYKENFIGLEITKTSLFNLHWLPFSWLLFLIGRVSKFNRLVGPKEVPPWLTNMGLIDSKMLQFGSAKVEDAFLTAPVGFPPLFIVGVSGFKESLTISIGFCPLSTPSQKVEELLDSFEIELGQLRGRNVN